MREQRAFLPPPCPLSLSQGGKWRVLWAGTSPPPTSFSPHSLEFRNRPLVPARATMDRLARGHSPQPRQGTLALSMTFRGGTPGQPPTSPMSESSPPAAPPKCSQAGGSAKGPGAVRFRGKGPQVGAAAAECERFRWEITGDNPARDGDAQQETSSEPGASCWPRGRGASR